MPRLSALVFLAAATTAALATAAPAIPENQEARGAGDMPVIPAVREETRRAIEGHEVAGVVTIVATPDRIIHLEAAGKADIDSGRPMRPDSIVAIASMTKPITATAVLMLQDQGKLSVDDPVAKHLPEFARLRGPDGKPARVTIRQLLTHTSGLAEPTAEESRGARVLADLIPHIVAKPLRFEPGSEWRYCQSGINTAGRIVEVASGEPFDEFLRVHLFEPLGMKDTTFYLSEDQLPRLATLYRKTESGTLERAELPFLQGRGPTSHDHYPAANGGLFSTATDYLRFCQMILGGGRFEGRSYLRPESVRLMTTLRTGDLRTGFTPGNGWGLGWCVVREPQGVTAMLSPGTFGHGGAYGTQAWIDPEQERIYLLMVQRANFPNSDDSEIRRAFQQAAAPGGD